MAKKMVKENTRIFKRISEVIERLSTKEISEERKKTLQPLIEFIQSKVDQKQTVSLNFICTHNSRRSHLSQVWAQTMARYFDVPNVFCFSGGTEATALFPVVAETLEEVGFEIEKGSESKNPQYSIKFGENELPIVGFSKVYDDPFNPQSNFAAIMTCSQADQDCPMILGAERRIAVAYDDPKMFDGTPFQKEKYEERSLEIASEMYYVFSRIEMRS